jgi:hypothetical protein
MKFVLTIILLGFLISSCSSAPSGDIVQTDIAQTQSSLPISTPIPTYTSLPTYTAYPTYTQFPTIAVEVTRIVMVTPTHTPTPLYTPTITHTPSNTFTPTITPNITQTAEALKIAKLRADKSSGFYLVNIDIAPGVWRSNGTNDDCYWEITTSTGDIINNFFGMAGGTAYIPSTAFQVQFDDCGTWTFLAPP